MADKALRRLAWSVSIAVLMGGTVADAQRTGFGDHHCVVYIVDGL
jgi:hypothetical protein